LFKTAGYNPVFESWVTDGTTYDLFYIKFNNIDKGAYNWGDYIPQDSTVIIAVPRALTAGIEAVLEAALGTVVEDNECITTTTTSTHS
jgi:hypothetical protein